MNDSIRPKIALTLGDPAGVGPELAAKLLADPRNSAAAEIYVLADRAELDDAAAVAGVEIPLSSTPEPGTVTLLDDRSAPAEPIPARQVSEAAGARTLHQLRRAVSMASAGEVGGIVFTPLNKTSLHWAGMHEEDELRWFAKELGYEGTTSEINIIDGLWTARVTSHISMQEVAQRVTAPNVTAAIELLHSLLHDSGIDAPRLGVCALNPHNGENGLFGREEIDHIRPGVEEAKSRGIDVAGPFPSDTIFLARENYDGIVTMYHDQGQIAVKLLGFDGGVTVQGGLPVVIATPAHGTAFDIAGQGIASTTSSQNALDVAIAVARRRAAAKAR
ncbi:4-hydroxythreonine-4-phosphate dehydrogenase PdxA [Saccharopolyspora sp. NFXS83]|uniref:4-hydroxythreonine-4-phosphate dehydrogenase PdxA n=1 Tax=Saccharopolyspora sp. NFXS83 TaxID=2993560 RepID=UPI00224A52B3|nr:4-hydroxythreonine-4-phosphate dehydrogenase PdxA [Saccharopolyspora sp. NFXS83]MCX2730722.1 4-hydroxythreonine-4-phosphate dehydrogenase PdxA [Saccharopolyspora sp. NFXS83]